MSEANHIYNPIINTNYVDFETKRDAIKEIIRTPIKSLFTVNTVNLWIENQRKAGRIYDKESLKLAIFVKKYMKLNSLSMQNQMRIFTNCLYNEYSWFQRTNQILENVIVKQNPEHYGFEKKSLQSDNYYNLILNYGLEEGEKLYQQKRQRLKGENNPAYNHGGKFSPYSENFIHYQNENAEYTINDVKEKSNQTKEEHPERQPTRIEYWLALGYDDKTAKDKLSEYQTRFSLEICQEKYGDKEGYRIWK